MSSILAGIDAEGDAAVERNEKASQPGGDTSHLLRVSYDLVPAVRAGHVHRIRTRNRRSGHDRSGGHGHNRSDGVGGHNLLRCCGGVWLTPVCLMCAIWSLAGQNY